MDSFETRVLALKPNLERYARHLAHKQWEDLVQDTFLKIFSKRTLYDERESLKTWCNIILYHTFCDDYRDKNMVKDKWDDLHHIAKSKNVVVNTATYSFEVNELLNLLEHPCLSKKERACLKLRMQGYKYKDVAKILKLNVETVKGYILRGRAKLKPILNK